MFFSFKRNKIRKIALWLNYFDDFLISYLIFMLSSLAVGLASKIRRQLTVGKQNQLY